MSMLSDVRIFIVEDNATNLAIVSAILRRHGAIISHDRWGLDTVPRIIKTGDVDVILLDLMFPGDVTGYDVFDEIKSMSELQHVPVVAVTASDPAIEMNKAREKGFMGFITKPIDHKKFPEQIATVITGTPVWAADALDDIFI